MIHIYSKRQIGIFYECFVYIFCLIYAPKPLFIKEEEVTKEEWLPLPIYLLFISDLKLPGFSTFLHMLVICWHPGLVFGYVMCMLARRTLLWVGVQFCQHYWCFTFQKPKDVTLLSVAFPIRMVEEGAYTTFL